MSLLTALMGIAETQLRAKSPIGSAVGEAVGTAIAERQIRKRNEKARTASLRHLKLERFPPPEEQRARMLELADHAALLREKD